MGVPGLFRLFVAARPGGALAHVHMLTGPDSGLHALEHVAHRPRVSRIPIFNMVENV
jgi:hypothetical protein